MNPFANANYAEAQLDATLAELAELKIIAEQLAEALQMNRNQAHKWRCVCAMCEDRKLALESYNAWKAKR